MSEWRSMADERPSEDGCFLTLVRLGPDCPLHPCVNRWVEDSNPGWGGRALMPDEEVVYWMPLPEPPAAVTASTSPTAG